MSNESFRFGKMCYRAVELLLFCAVEICCLNWSPYTTRPSGFNMLITNDENRRGTGKDDTMDIKTNCKILSFLILYFAREESM